MRLAVSTGGGDTPGLNAVIRAVVLSGLRRVWEVAAESFGIMVSYRPPPVTTVPLDEVLDKPKRVPLDGDEICTAGELGVAFGD